MDLLIVDTGRNGTKAHELAKEYHVNSQICQTPDEALKLLKELTPDEKPSMCLISVDDDGLNGSSGLVDHLSNETGTVSVLMTGADPDVYKKTHGLEKQSIMKKDPDSFSGIGRIVIASYILKNSNLRNNKGAVNTYLDYLCKQSQSKT